MNIRAILDNTQLVNLCMNGFDIIYDMLRDISKIENDYFLQNKRLRAINLITSNALQFLNASFDDALMGKYPPCVVNMRASLETHLMIEKINSCTEEEFNIWKSNINTENEDTFRKYWKIFGPTKLMKQQINVASYKKIYSKISQYAHAGPLGIQDNITKITTEDSERRLVAYSPYYQKDITERCLKDLLVFMWLNGNSISKIYKQQLPANLTKRLDIWSSELEVLGILS